MTDGDWKCAGCGAPSPGRFRSCDCPTSIVYKSGQLREAARWKLERYHAVTHPIRRAVAHFFFALAQRIEPK